ncbi:LuxR C-terminal-related transcriptional regulator [Streptomyces sp. NPDC014685]|uniref:LuxR C-terminal-related transcriptional regulator n=1 Tax=Streptomyces sp. NPDC014685 TaxID=3364881 RepID=UPI003702E761
MLRILVISGSPVIRLGLEGLLNATDDMSVADSHSRLGEGLDSAGGSAVADAVILDMSAAVADIDRLTDLAERIPVLVMTHLSDVRELLDVRSAGVSGFVLTGSPEETVRQGLLDVRSAGVSGFVLTGSPEETVRQGLRSVAAGRRFMDTALPPAADGLRQDVKERMRQRPLSPREEEVLLYVARGYTQRQTATRMGVSAATVGTFLSRIRSKLELGNKAELTLAAVHYLTNPQFPAPTLSAPSCPQPRQGAPASY